MSYGTICAIVGAGELACWGKNYIGGLAVDPAVTSRTETPLIVEGLPGRVQEINMNQQAVCALLENRDLYCWGSSYGAPYDPGSYTHFEPTHVLSDVTKLDRGSLTGWFAYVENEGTWYSWGGALGREFGDTSQALPCCDF
jgi:hypothetical protein